MSEKVSNHGDLVLLSSVSLFLLLACDRCCYGNSAFEFVFVLLPMIHNFAEIILEQIYFAGIWVFIDS